MSSRNFCRLAIVFSVFSNVTAQNAIQIAIISARAPDFWLRSGLGSDSKAPKQRKSMVILRFETLLALNLQIATGEF